MKKVMSGILTSVLTLAVTQLGAVEFNLNPQVEKALRSGSSHGEFTTAKNSNIGYTWQKIELGNNNCISVSDEVDEVYFLCKSRQSHGH